MLKSLAASMVLLTSIPLASGSIFVTDLVDGTNSLPIGGNQAWQGQLGDDFTTTANLKISDVGVFDDDGDGTFSTLIWRLYNVATGALVREETFLPSGPRTPGTTIEDNYIFQAVAPNFLEANTIYSAVAVGFNNIDENFNTNMNLANLDVIFNSLGLNAAGGRYSNTAAPLLPALGPSDPNSASDQPYNFGAATFRFGVVPEPASVLVWSLIVAGVGAVVAKRSM